MLVLESQRGEIACATVSAVPNRYTRSRLIYLALEITKYEALSSARISLLVKPDDFDRGDFLQICAQNRGVQLSAFTEYENAMNWLTTENEIDLQEIS